MRAAHRPDLPLRSSTSTSLRVSRALCGAVLLVAALVPAGQAVASTPACGAFTGGVHEVATAEQLASIGIGAPGADCDPARSYRLVNDITVPKRGAPVVIAAFTGVFDGDGHTITLDLDHTDASQTMFLGLFQRLEGATVSDLKLAGSVATVGFGQTGALAAFVSGTGVTTIEQVTSTVDVSGRNDVGGLIGRAEATGLLTLASIEVGTSDVPVELEAVRHSGGLIGTTTGPVLISSASVHARTTLRDPGGSDNNFHGGLTSFVTGNATFTVDGGVTGGSFGVTVGYELVAPDRPVGSVGGIAGSIIGVDDVVIRGVSVDVAIETAGTGIGGIAGSIEFASTTTIGGASADDAVLVTGSVTDSSASFGRAGGIATFHTTTSGTTTVRGLTMDAAISGDEVGGLYASVNGTLTVMDTVVSGPVQGRSSAGGIASNISSATLVLDDVVIASDIVADQVGGIADSGAVATMTLADVQVTGRLRTSPAATDGFRGVGGLFLGLSEVTFPAAPTFTAAEAIVEASFPEGLEVGTAFLRAAGLVASLGSDIDPATLAGPAPTMTITVSDALRDSRACVVASRFIRTVSFGVSVRIDPLSPDPCPPDGSTTTDDSDDDTEVGSGGIGGGSGDESGGASGEGSGVGLACTWSALVVGAQVTCEVTGGPVDAELLWNARVNPVVAGGPVALDGAGAGTFAFIVPRTAHGQPLTVELVEWREPLLLGTVTGLAPTSVPAGLGGPALSGGTGPRQGVREGLLVLLVGALGSMALRSHRRTSGGLRLSR